MKPVEAILRSMDFEFFARGQHKISPSMFLIEQNAVFLDVRSKKERDTISFGLVHHMPVLHIAIDEIPDRVSEIPKDTIVGVFCSSGVRSTMVYLYLRALGFDKVRIIEGGYVQLVEELKPGKLLKHFSEKGDKK